MKTAGFEIEKILMEYDKRFVVDKQVYGVDIFRDFLKASLVRLEKKMKTKIRQAEKEARAKVLDEQIDEMEEQSVIAEKNYSAGYNDALKGRKPAPHDTRDGYCCACDYDIAGFKAEIKRVESL